MKYVMPVRLKKQSGSAILIAIFVVIIVALLGASLASLQRSSAQGTSVEVYAARAYLSAYSASEIALTELFPVNSMTGNTMSATDCSVVNKNPILPVNNVGFHACTVENICSSTAATVGVNARYNVVSTATCSSGDIISRRQITVEASAL